MIRKNVLNVLIKKYVNNRIQMKVIESYQTPIEGNQIFTYFFISTNQNQNQSN